LSSLKLSSKNQSWSVKDTGFYAATKFLTTYPKECEEYFEEYTKFWTQQTSDNVQSVRENSAINFSTLISSQDFSS